MNKMISCDQYDYIEIACTFQYPIKLTLKLGEVVNGTALDTIRNDHKDECIKVNVNGVDNLIVLDEISVMEVCVENPHFKVVSFT